MEALCYLFRRNWDIKTSLVDAFITFLYLSSVKFMSVSFDLLAPVHVKQLDSVGNETESWHLYYDATIPYFGKKHIPYAVLALSVLTLFTILPTLVLLFYPFACFQKVLNTLPICQHVLHTFMVISGLLQGRHTTRHSRLSMVCFLAVLFPTIYSTDWCLHPELKIPYLLCNADCIMCCTDEYGTTFQRREQAFVY